MKRTAAAGTLALLAGGATLLLVASIFYSCRGGGKPHDMGTSATDSAPSPVTRSALLPAEGSDASRPDVSHRLTLNSPSPDAL